MINIQKSIMKRLSQIIIIKQKYFYLAISILITSILPVYAQEITKPILGANLVQNAGFEDGSDHWQIPANTAKVVGDFSRSGSKSLFYSNTNAKQYKLFKQTLKVTPGQRLHFSAWIKGEGVKAQKSSEGASLFIESTGSSGYLGGTHPRRLTGTFDWTQIQGEFYVFPGATNTSLGLYLRKGAKGKVWFDDVEVRVEQPAPFNSYLIYPNYRGTVLQGDTTKWKFQIQIHPQPDWKNSPVKVVNALTDSQGKVLLHTSNEVAPTKESAEIVLDVPPHLGVGNYTLQQTITDPNGEKVLQDSHAIHVVKKMPNVYIDAQGFTIANGKRFFPMGVFINADTDSDLDLQRIAEGGFNTVLSYYYGGKTDPQADMKPYMENAQKRGLKVIYSLKDMYPGKHGYGNEAFDVAAKHLEMMRDNPALLAWYTNDEMGREWMTKMTKMYNLVKQLDPNHPAYQVQNKMEELENNATIADVLGIDPYPVGSDDLSSTSVKTGVAQNAARAMKGLWIVPQLFDLSTYFPDQKSQFPSLNEMRNQAFQAIINGAKGLIWYSYYGMMYEKYPRDKSTFNMELFHRRWTDTSAMAKEMDAIIPVILQDNKVTLDVPQNADVQVAAWQNGNELLILLANPYYEEKDITFTLPHSWKIKEANQGQINSTIHDGKITFTLPSIGSGVFRLKR